MRRLLRKFGYELVKTKKDPNLDTFLRNYFKRVHVDVVIDIGANIGQFGKKLRSLGYRGEIYSFEPVSESYRRLLKNSKNDLNWFAFNYGFAEESGDAIINVSRSSDFSSILDTNDFGTDFFSKKMSRQGTENIKLRRFDSFYSEQNFQDQSLLMKLDTQGYDLSVLRGSVNSLSAIGAILTETAFIPIYSGMPLFDDIRSFVEKYDFKLSFMFPVSKNAKGQIIETDSFFTK